MLFVFFKQKTAYEMRISDWSSDVCSSDLRAQPGFECAAILDAVTGLDMSQQRRHRAAQRFVATARGGGNDFAVEQPAHFEAVAIVETMHAQVRGECALQRAGIGTLSVEIGRAHV